MSLFGYELHWEHHVGGVFLIPMSEFKELNGFSNMYWGWGKEDDDFSYRIRRSGREIIRRPGVFLHLDHPKESMDFLKENEDRLEYVISNNYDISSEGLSDVKYTLQNRLTVEVNGIRFDHLMLDVGNK